MGAKLTIFILPAFLLWSSLLAPRYKSKFFKCREIIIKRALIITKDIGIDAHFLFKKRKADDLGDASPFLLKHVRFHLLFMVLRN